MGYFSFLFSPKAVILTKTFFRFIVKKRFCCCWSFT
jgi:hypothetical protein